LSNTSSSFYLGNDGGVWSGTQNAITNDLNTGSFIDFTQLYGGGVGNMGPDANLYGGAQDNGELQDQGGPLGGLSQWNAVDLASDGGQTVVDYTNNAIVYDEMLGFPQLDKSTNGGTSWTTVMDSTTLGLDRNFVWPLLMSPNNDTELFTATDQVYKTTNSGGAWTAISP
jgi:hypothetical protein